HRPNGFDPKAALFEPPKTEPYRQAGNENDRENAGRGIPSVGLPGKHQRYPQAHRKKLREIGDSRNSERHPPERENHRHGIEKIVSPLDMSSAGRAAPQEDTNGENDGQQNWRPDPWPKRAGYVRFSVLTKNGNAASATVGAEALHQV
ncbi:MAG: hypothetical protein ACXWSC_20085, partial [Bdellovibrionota bacterium]